MGRESVWGGSTLPQYGNTHEVEKVLWMGTRSGESTVRMLYRYWGPGIALASLYIYDLCTEALGLGLVTEGGCREKVFAVR